MRFVLALSLLPLAAAAVEPVTLHWLGDAAPAAPNGITWGVPWPKGALHKEDSLTLTTAEGKTLPVQTWPVAFWPDGSVKWSGHAITAAAGLTAPLRLAPGATAAPATPIKVRDETKFVEVDTGAMRVRLTKDPLNPNVVESIAIGDRVVAESGRLHVSLEDRTGLEGPKFDATEGHVERVTVEQSGPVRAVVKVEGHLADKHLVGEGGPWLPFVLRFQFFAGSGAIRLTHSFVYDGSPPVDLIKGLGLSFQVPFREELHNRHLRIAGDADGGMWNQPVRMLPGYRPQVGRGVGDLYPRHLAGERVPNLADFDPRTREAILTVPVWEEAKLTQDSPNGWSLQKRTSFVYPWLHVTDGQRARGFALMGDVSGALAIGVKDFWQKAPKALELREAHSPAGSFSVWLWSRDGPAMTLGRYDEDPHGLAINYEDWKPGWGTALGIANTHDLTLWACDKIPSNEQLVAMAREAAAPPLLVCTPEYYHAQQAGGRWSLPDRSTPATRWIEDQVGTFVNYYRDQVDERSWYGFWDFGDIMHNYDFGRHEWRYDIGGWAWANTELMPDLLLWYSFLRTGRADLFRMAEAMTRHTSEVDVHHVGPFAPLGSRHNVNHWGDGAKQPRVSHAGLKRTYYLLTGGDGRIGDLLREQIDADLTYSYLQRFNNAHYVPDANGGEPHLQSANSVTAPRPENFAPRPTAASRQPFTRFGLEWMCYAANWTTEWERGGDQAWRARLETDMKTMASNLDAQGRFPGRYFDMIFGGPENLWEMEPMYDLPEFWRAWANTCESVGRQVEGGQMTGPRMLAYAAFKKNDAALGQLAWEKLLGRPGRLPPVATPKKFSGPGVLRPVTDPDFLGASVGWQLHGVASVQWALNALETLEFAKPWLPLWENPPAPKK